MWPRSASRPSDTSSIAVAPALAAWAPAGYGGSGARCAPTTFTGDRKPRPSTANPAADQPSRPHTATTSPGSAPERVTGSRPSRSPNAVIDTTSMSLVTMSPPTTPAPARLASAHMPADISSTTVALVAPGQPNPTRIAV